MHPLLNPLSLIWMAKSYLSEIDRIFNLDKKSMDIYRDKALKKIVKYAYNVPIYRKKYKKTGIKPEDIKGISDIKKLPIITKEDFRVYSPEDIIPTNCNIKDLQTIRTTGTISQRLHIYADFYTIIKTLLGHMRVLKYHGIDWKKDKITMIIDLIPKRVERVYFRDTIPTIPILRNLFPLNNIQFLDVKDKRENLIKNIQEFHPDIIGSYPEILRRIAAFIEVKKIRDIKPRYILTSADYVDEYRKKYIENIFDSKIFDEYTSTEGGPMAFECEQSDLHINSDFVHVEIAKNGEILNSGTGEIVVTRLYGGGTPIIRYTGLDDMVTIDDKECSCGIPTNLIKKIHGRKSLSITLPNGKKIYTSALQDTLFNTMLELGTSKIYLTQIVQNKIDQIEILIIIDDELRDVGSPVEKILNKIKENFNKMFDSTVNVVVKEVKKIKPRTPFVISRIS